MENVEGGHGINSWTAVYSSRIGPQAYEEGPADLSLSLCLSLTPDLLSFGTAQRSNIVLSKVTGTLDLASVEVVVVPEWRSPRKRRLAVH